MLDATELSTTSIDIDSSLDAESLDSSTSGTCSSNKHSLDDSLDGADNHTDDDTIQHEPSQMECFSNRLYFQTKLLKILDDTNAPHFLFHEIIEWVQKNTHVQSTG